MESMLGVRPIMPFVYAPTFQVPMSSPQMTTMLGFLSTACAGASAPKIAGIAVRSASM